MKILVACDNCGKVRLVEILHGEPKSKLCWNCSRKSIGERRRGSNNPRWNGGEKYHPEGYVLVYKPEHPFSNISGYVRRSRLVIEESIGRFLRNTEEVHHVNKVKDDDRLENLEILSHKKHMLKHLSELFRERNYKGQFVTV